MLANQLFMFLYWSGLGALASLTEEDLMMWRSEEEDFSLFLLFIFRLYEALHQGPVATFSAEPNLSSSSGLTGEAPTPAGIIGLAFWMAPMSISIGSNESQVAEGLTGVWYLEQLLLPLSKYLQPAQVLPKAIPVSR